MALMPCGEVRASATSSPLTESLRMLRHPPLADGWIDSPHRRLELGDLPLESGEVLRDAFVSYVIHGDPALLPNAAILVTTAIGSTHHRLDFLIGAGNALDSDRYCIVVADALGNGLSSSPSNSKHQPGPLFPRITIRDMVASQHRLLDHLGVRRLHAVVGASMGGMQALQWGVSHPKHMAALVAITPMAHTARWSQLVNEISRRALFSDAHCRTPRPREEAMRLWVPLTQWVIPSTPAALQQFDTHEALLAAIEQRTQQLIEHGPDPFDWCCQTWAYDAHDVGDTPGCAGDTAVALACIEARTLVLAPKLDLYNPPVEARFAGAQIAGAHFVELPGVAGHASASGGVVEATPALRDVVRNFLREPHQD
jgi:homoserine O-acetyltransferase